jgi:tetratricopeptide (TPR) repeat protein
VLPLTFDSKASYAEQARAAGSTCIAEATSFVSHSYEYFFLEVVEAIAAWEAKDPSRASTFFYFDLLVVNQHGQGAVVDFERLRDEFGGSVRAIGHTILVLKWDNPVPLTRAWCVFEMGVTLAAKAKMEVIMPPQDAAAFKRALVKDFGSLTLKTCTVHVENAKAKEKSDQENIQRAIKESGGYLKTNQLVIGAMRAWMVGEARAELNAVPADQRATSALSNGLASLLWSLGKPGEAEALFREALAGHKRTHGRDHLSTLATTNNLGATLSDQGKLDEAEALYREALDGYKRTRGHAHPETLSSINNLAGLLSQKGELKEAEQLHREALKGRRCAQGNDHADTLTSINNLGILLQEQGSFGEAEALYREALAGRRRTLRSDHPSTLRTISSLAFFLKGQGKLDEAEPLFLEALAEQRRALGAHHEDTLRTTSHLAGVYFERERFGEAVPLYRQLVAGSLRALGKEHPRTASSMDMLNKALALMAQKGQQEGIKEEVREGPREVVVRQRLSPSCHCAII